MQFFGEDHVPQLTAEEAERSGLVLVQKPDGFWYVAHTVVDPETGGVYAVPQDGAKPNRIEITGG